MLPSTCSIETEPFITAHNRNLYISQTDKAFSSSLGAIFSEKWMGIGKWEGGEGGRKEVLEAS